jgi:CRP-like cAMP-binding protein
MSKSYSPGSLLAISAALQDKWLPLYGQQRLESPLDALSKIEVKNRLLASLPHDALDALRPHMTRIDLPIRHVLVEPDVPIESVCFIESGLGSVVASSTDDEHVEVGHVGRDGVSGYHVALSSETTPHKTFMQIAGSGMVVPTEKLLQVFDRLPALRNVFLRYALTCEVQLAHSALASARYNMHERLARWLLMCHDRVDGDDLPLTHEFLSLMLGVRRSGVTDTIHIIEGYRAIKAARGNIRVLDRDELVEVAGGCYGLPEREYERLIGVSLRA